MIVKIVTPHGTKSGQMQKDQLARFVLFHDITEISTGIFGVTLRMDGDLLVPEEVKIAWVEQHLGVPVNSGCCGK